jgi:chromosome segregation and condensation protein ScpB
VWEALLASDDDVSYQQIARRTGLRLNTVKNYRAQLLPELANHGLEDLSLKQMRDFALRCRPFLEPFIRDVLARSRARSDP